ncbi:Fe2+-dependent dioxygenase [Gluconacetobacter tumulisoli]|uniref:Fe2+-dependent dioxygenase n=1 Tax=Gluconacetobacter tumulisoli TaxID=1286189 RepID=A0A7W4K788_9PROT|nr:Fe2+-dependent dioxygenase [Gluconacetobacter tumulisoli]MBB2201636.1 Fe2+-dependent dioxygenase [Gluconacetobacter tumulisoli]
MLLAIPHVLDDAEIASFRTRLMTASWTDGRATAGHQSARAKQNLQIAEDDPLGRELGEELARALGRMPLFVSAALPQRIFPPLFSRYRAGAGDRFDNHVDNAIRYDARGTIRTDVSATLFLTPPDEYDGGTLVIDDVFGPREVRLPAGSLVLYPSSSLHRVTPVTRGERLAAVFWMQSLVRDEGQRRILFDLDRSIQDLAADLVDDPRILSLTNIYHNLVRRWGTP